MGLHSYNVRARMIQAKGPCRQLNSAIIRGTALCFMSPVVASSCSIISAKCVCDAQEKKNCKSHGIPSVVRVILAMKSYQVCSSGNWSFFEFRPTHVQVQLIHFLFFFFSSNPKFCIFLHCCINSTQKKGQH